MENRIKNKIELLAPAGNRECFDAAMRFGADAVYLSGQSFGLRNFAPNFTEEELAQVVADAHALGRRVFITVNALLYNEEIARVEAYLRYLKEIDVDAVIISDPGILEHCKGAGLEIHISTQMSTLNYASAAFWHSMGAKRVVMGREASLREIAYVAENTPETLEIEAFIHGAMCVAHSGRCLLSNVMTDRSGNRGACAQPCRWQYTMHEVEKPGEEYPILEDARGTYVLNSRDLMMLEHIPELIESGITSFKIEGRMKSAYYVASVVGAYRRAINAYLKDGSYTADEASLQDLADTATRGFTTGFYFDKGLGATDTVRPPKVRSYSFCGAVRGVQNEGGLLLIEQRNKFSLGDTLRVLSPSDNTSEFKVTHICDIHGNAQQSAPHPQQALYINCPYPLEAGDFLRLKREDAS